MLRLEWSFKTSMYRIQFQQIEQYEGSQLNPGSTLFDSNPLNTKNIITQDFYSSYFACSVTTQDFIVTEILLLQKHKNLLPFEPKENLH